MICCMIPLSFKKQEELIDRVRIGEWVIFGEKGWVVIGGSTKGQLLSGLDLSIFI